MIKIGRLCLVLVICFFTGNLKAQEKKIIYKKSETHKFNGLKLKGEFKKPDLSYIYQRKGIRSEQIIDIPEDFNRDIREDGQRF
jgi:hypothetical protein